jgi:hypothetical protein
MDGIKWTDPYNRRRRSDHICWDQTNRDIHSIFELLQNYPNPFNPATKIKFSVIKSSDIDLKIFSIEGKIIAEIFEDEK